MAARALFLDTATLSILSYHQDRSDPVISLWNEPVRSPDVGGLNS